MSELFGNPEQVSELSGNPEQLPYTPTTEEVRRQYSFGVVNETFSTWGQAEGFFDRWLAEVVRKAKEEAWYIGASTAVNYALNGSASLPENPYEVAT